MDLTADGDGGGGAAAPEPSPAKREMPPSAMAQLHGAQQVKLEAVEEMQDGAQFIDKLQTKIDKLKQLAAQASADGAAIEEAVKEVDCAL